MKDLRLNGIILLSPHNPQPFDCEFCGGTGEITCTGQDGTERTIDCPDCEGCTKVYCHEMQTTSILREVDGEPTIYTACARCGVMVTEDSPFVVRYTPETCPHCVITHCLDEAGAKCALCGKAMSG